MTKELPTAIRESLIKIGGISIKVYQLDNGQRVLDAYDVHRFFEYLEDSGNLSTEEAMSLAKALKEPQ